LWFSELGFGTWLIFFLNLGKLACEDGLNLFPQSKLFGFSDHG
jgi:hypothetical protein